MSIGRSFAGIREWVTAIAVYAVALHALAMAGMPAFGGVLEAPAIAAHQHGAETTEGGGHADANHVQCCVLCGITGCGGPVGNSAVGGDVVRARRRIGPSRQTRRPNRPRTVRQNPPRGPPA